MPTSFPDHFSALAADYARYRPTYPAVLYTYLAHLTPRHDRALDCGTGNGQAAHGLAAHGLAAHYATVVATDASADQLAEARPHPRITFRTAPAEQMPLPGGSVDLVTVAQAVHWFDRPAFYAEVQRVLRPGGILALWTYDLFRISPAVDRVVQVYYRDLLGPYWPPERVLVEARYRTLSLPLAEVQAPIFTYVEPRTLDDVLGYLRTWSARRRYVQARGTDPLTEVEEALHTAWGQAASRAVTWTLSLRIGRAE